MARIQIPLDALTSRLNFQERFGSLSTGTVGSRFSNLRPISDFLDFKRLSKPANFGEAQSRVNYNLSHYSSNYAVVFAMLSLYALLTNWLLMFDIIFVVAGMFVIGRLDGRDLEIGTFKATTSQLYTGLLVIAIPLGLLASPFATLLWLIGASGVVILGHASFMDKPIDEAFSGEAGSEDEEDDDITSSGDDDDYDEGAELAQREREEEALVQSALARIQRAQDRGKREVKLNKEELAALERRRKRIQEEEAAAAAAARRANASASGSERKRRKEKEKRFAIPLAQLEPAPRKKGKKSPPVSDDNLPRHPSPANAAETPRREVLPPMGFFPPPSASRTRPRSSTTSSHRSSRAVDDRRGSSPFNPAAYAQPPSAHRHVSDTVSSRPRSSRGALPPEDSWTPGLSPASSSSSISRSRHSLDPHMFQMESSRAPYQTGAGATSRRHLAGPAEARRSSGPPAAARGGRSSRRPSPDETSEAASETSDPDTSDDLGNGVQIVDPPLRRGRRSEIVVEEEPADPRREASRGKKSSNSSPVKRKPVASGRKKKK
ncbi:hypothetical protein ACHAQH_003756 [Verticillium albo-atrum]